jgi:hypothetical protein
VRAARRGRVGSPPACRRRVPGTAAVVDLFFPGTSVPRFSDMLRVGVLRDRACAWLLARFFGWIWGLLGKVDRSILFSLLEGNTASRKTPGRILPRNHRARGKGLALRIQGQGWLRKAPAPERTAGERSPAMPAGAKPDSRVQWTRLFARALRLAGPTADKKRGYGRRVPNALGSLFRVG